MKDDNKIVFFSLLLFFYSAIALFLNGSLFRRGWSIPSIILLMIVAFFIPIMKSNFNLMLENFRKFSMNFLTIIIAMVTFVLLNQGGLIPTEYIEKAKMSIIGIVFNLFFVFLLTLFVYNIKSKKTKEFMVRLVLFLFLDLFFTIISLICGIIILNGKIMI